MLRQSFMNDATSTGRGWIFYSGDIFHIQKSPKRRIASGQEQSIGWEENTVTAIAHRAEQENRDPQDHQRVEQAKTLIHHTEA